MPLDPSLLKSLPRYKSHKIVGAARITAIAPQDDGALTLSVELDRGGVRHQQILTAAELKGKPAPELHGFLVAYDDGYFSFSPGKTFIAGYDPV